MMSSGKKLYLRSIVTGLGVSFSHLSLIIQTHHFLNCWFHGYYITCSQFKWCKPLFSLFNALLYIYISISSMIIRKLRILLIVSNWLSISCNLLSRKVNYWSLKDLKIDLNLDPIIKQQAESKVIKKSQNRF